VCFISLCSADRTLKVQHQDISAVCYLRATSPLVSGEDIARYFVVAVLSGLDLTVYPYLPVSFLCCAFRGVRLFCDRGGCSDPPLLDSVHSVVEVTGVTSTILLAICYASYQLCFAMSLCSRVCALPGAHPSRFKRLSATDMVQDMFPEYPGVTPHPMCTPPIR
jgi:hypothetical protein